jgi:predicted SAM-dependent methyltransferase
MYNLPFNYNQKIIEIGGGNKPWFRPNLDVRSDSAVDIVANIEENLPIKDNEYEGVFCRYAIEHISWRKIRKFIKEVYRILAPGGTAVFITADLLEQARILTEISNFEDKWICMIFGDNDYPENSHRCGFSPEFAGRIFKEIGFDRVIITRHPEWRGDMIIEATKLELNNPEYLFDKEYFNGGKKVGGYAHEGYRDFPVHWITAEKILGFKPKSVLEIGCARGYILKKIQDKGVPVGGLEISNHCYLTRAMDNITQWDLCKTPWPIPDKYFDLCYSIAVLEHIPEKYVDAVIKEIDRVSERGVHGIDFGENDDGFDKTHFTLKDKKWWEEKFSKNQIIFDKELFEKYEGSLINHLPTGDNQLKVNIGSHILMFHNGWVNLDILPLEQFAKNEGHKFLRWDAKNKLPFDDSSVDLMYSSHFLEHLTYEEAEKFLEDCKRVMKPGATFRIIVPDLELLIKQYQDKTIAKLDEINDESANINHEAGKFWKLLFNGHSATYDWNSLKMVAEKIGFIAKKQKFRQGNEQIIKETLDTLPCLSLYVELVKN